MIVSFGDKTTEDIYHGRETNRTRRLSRELIVATQIKLDMIDAASTLLDLKSPPGNRLEPLKGDLKDRYSIRVNLQWRLVFRFIAPNAFEVQLLDYHS